MKTFPKLYKKTSTGADQYWSVEVEESKITSRWGQVDGAEQVTTDVIAAGKNAGRANATTPEQQAELEAEALWTKKKKKGYMENLTAAQAGEIDSIIEGGIFPMLAHKFRDHADKLVYPCFVQPKLDGHRCIAMDGKLWSRTRKEIRSMPHICEAVSKLKVPYPLDGELYNHTYHSKFEDISSLIRPDEPKPGHEVVQYHVYDVAMLQTGFARRSKYVTELLVDAGLPLVRVDTQRVHDEDELMEAFEDYREQGYEGAIVRNADGLYVNKRSYDLLKLKEMDDAEFEVIGVNEGRGKLAGHGIFKCRTGDGAVFEAKMKGELVALKQYYEHPELAVGRMLTVQYQGLTNKSGVPRFPVALRFEDKI